MNPPIREIEHQQRLWEAVVNDEVAIIGSDHAPHTIEEKNSPTQKSLRNSRCANNFPLMLNAHLENKISLEQLVNYFVSNPVEVFNIKNKGQIKEGFDGISPFLVIETSPLGIRIKQVSAAGHHLMEKN